VPKDLLSKVNSEAVLAVSVEPPGGSTAGQPTGPVIANGKLDHTTLVAAVKAAGLVDTLEGKGPFTVFALTNDAFAKLLAGTVDTLLKPENKGQLTQVLTYHVVPGRITAKDLMEMIQKGGARRCSRRWRAPSSPSK
jgi:uncharacterized surface protein with fasciclin (FAS1) repeats